MTQTTPTATSTTTVPIANGRCRSMAWRARSPEAPADTVKDSSSASTTRPKATSDRTVNASFAQDFTDTVLVGKPIELRHLTQLRAAIDFLRARLGLAPGGWTDPSPAAQVTTIKRVQVAEMRSALMQITTTAGNPAPGFGEAIASGETPIRARHFEEIRAAIRNLE